MSTAPGIGAEPGRRTPPAPSASSRAARGRAWPRVLVLLLALFLGAPPAALATPGAVPFPAGESVEYDVPDTAVRPPGRSVHRPAAPPRPVPAPAPRGPAALCAGPGLGPVGASPRPPYALRGLRTVVLRC